MQFTKKAVQTPTRNERQGAAEELSVGALDAFDRAARDLELSAELHAEVADEALEESDRLLTESVVNSQRANSIRAKANKIRNFFG